MITELSNDIANIVEAAGASVVQVQGRGRPASGVVYGEALVVTTARAAGGDEHPRVRRAEGEWLDAVLVGIDPTTRVALLSAPGVAAAPLAAAPLPRVGHIAVAIARSWSNRLTATAGVVSVIGGPLPTGHRRAIEQVIRTSAPMHEGFAGGAFVSTNGELLGIATAASIRGLGVVIPTSIAWQAAAELLKRRGLKRGYLGIAAQPIRVPEKQRGIAGADDALLIVGVKDGTPAADAGMLVGDVLLSLESHVLKSPEDLFELLIGDRVGRPVSLLVLRGGVPTDVTVTVGER